MKNLRFLILSCVLSALTLIGCGVAIDSYAGSMINPTGGASDRLTLGSATKVQVTASGAIVTGNISSTLDAIIHGITVGLGGGSVATNTAVGVSALISNTTGYQNTANGMNSLYYNTGGYSNTANGNASLVLNTTGYQNTANGVNSLYYNTAGYSNAANGFTSLFSNTTGSYNTASGVSALYSTTTGNYNAALGYLAGYGVAGVNANTTGSNNTFLGYATVGAGAADTNEIVIGANAVGLGSNTTVIGSASTTISNIKGRVLIGTTTDDGVNALQVNGSVKVTGVAITPTYTVSGLPTCNAGLKGAHANASDVIAVGFAMTIASGGAFFVPVTCSGSAWIQG